MKLLHLFLCCALSRTALAGEAAWPTFRGDASRTGCIEPGASPAGRKAWVFRDPVGPGTFASSPAVVDGRIYVGSDNGKVYCLDAVKGTVIWTFAAARPVFASPVVVEGRVYVGEGLHQDSNCSVYCLDAHTGKKVWEFRTISHVEFSPTLHDGRLYVTAGSDGVYCLDALTGQKLWQHRKAHVDQSPAVTAAGVFFGSVYDSSAIYCLDPKDGRVIWKKDSPLGLTGSPTADGDRVYFPQGNGTFALSHVNPAGGVLCLSAADGKELWCLAARDAVMTTVAVRDGNAFFGSRDGRLYCIEAASGKPIWTYDAGEPIVSSPATDGLRISFGCDDGSVYCLDALTGRKLWSFDASNLSFEIDSRIISSPALVNGRMYIGVMSLMLCLE